MRWAKCIQGPIFSVAPSRVTFLRDPAQYLHSLKSLAAQSERRVFLSGLYLGSDGPSKELVAAVESAMRQRPQMGVGLLFDEGRGTRPESSGETSVSTALPLIRRGARLHLWRSPNRVAWKEAFLGKRLSELLGVQHAKVHVFDDTVLLSGANLSQSYFEDRKDRYVRIDDPHVANFYHGLLETVATASYTAESESSMLKSSKVPSSETGRVLLAYLNQEHAGDCGGQGDASQTVFLAPTVQLGVCHVRHDERNTVAIMDKIASLGRGTFSLTSGYFNLTPAYERLIFKLGRALKKANIIVSSPEANAWFNSKGRHSRHVPSGYSWLEAGFLSRTTSSNLRTLEWKHGQWSFHCKGLWYFSDDEHEALSIIGSANFGNRSVNFDLESQAILFSQNKDFCDALQEELSDMERDCETVTLDLVKAEARTPPVYFRLLLPILKRWM